MFQKVPEVLMVLVVQLTLGTLQDLKILLDLVVPKVHSILLIQVDQADRQLLKILGLLLVQEIQVVLVVLVFLKGLEDLDYFLVALGNPLALYHPLVQKDQ